MQKLSVLLLVSLITACGRASDFDDASLDAEVSDSQATAARAGDVVIEAEAASSVTAFKVKSTSNASSGSYMQSPQGDDDEGTLVFDFALPETAKYYLWVRGRGPNGSSDSVYASFDSNTHTTINVPSKSWVWRSASGRKLTKGNHEIAITVRESGVEVDEILLTKSSDTPSGIVAPTVTTPTQPTEPTDPDATLPAELLNLTNWKVTLPTGSSGSPREVKQPELATFSVDPWFRVSSDGGVAFRANAGGVTTSGSSYPRSELREMANNGSANASWSTSSGTHSMTVREAITHLPVVKPHVVAAQIHDAEDDVVMVRLEGTHLFLEGDGQDLGNLDSSYVLGTTFTIRLVASGGVIKAYYNDLTTPKVTVSRAKTGCYFKAGAYTQSNTSKGDSASAYGEVVIYDLDLEHN